MVGASNNPAKWSHKILQNIIEAGYEGKIFPINPKDDTIQGLRAYKSILDVPEDIDMMSICIDAKQVPEILRQGVRKGVKCAVIFSNGFREAGRKDLEDELLEAIRGSSLRIIGPNVQGIIHTASKLSNIFNMEFPKQGGVGIISQSGSISAYIAEKMKTEHIGISTLINLGNQVDLSETDFLDYLSQDDRTKVIALYLEGPRDSQKFKHSVIAAATKKPVVVMKPGSSEDGKEAAASHTGSIGGNDVIFTQACRQYGIMRCDTMTEYVDTIIAFAACKQPQGNRVAVISTSGGVGSIVADELNKCGLKLLELPNEAIEDIKLTTKKTSGVGGVMDMADSLANWEILINALEDKYRDYFDIYFLMIADGLEGFDKVAADISQRTDKTVIVCFMSDGDVRHRGAQFLRSREIPVYECPDRGARALTQMVRYNENRRAIQE